MSLSKKCSRIRDTPQILLLTYAEYSQISIKLGFKKNLNYSTIVVLVYWNCAVMIVLLLVEIICEKFSLFRFEQKARNISPFICCNTLPRRTSRSSDDDTLEIFAETLRFYFHLGKCDICNCTYILSGSKRFQQSVYAQSWLVGYAGQLVCMYNYMSVCLSIYLNVCLSACSSIRLFVCMYIFICIM